MPDLRAKRAAATRSVFFCGQSLFKFHPDFDLILAGILTQCPEAEFVVIDGESKTWTRLLDARWRRTIPQVIDRIRVVPRVSGAGYVDLLAGARVSLDTPHFCGGMTSYESMAVGTPVVTLPGAYTRGRITRGYLRHIGVPELIAESSAAYIEQAVRLAHDDAYRQAMSERISAGVPIMTDPSPIAEHAAFFERAVVDAARR